MRPNTVLPSFDPADGGLSAPLLVLLEKPSPIAASTGIISRDNRNGQLIRVLMERAGIPRTAVLLWNAVPWWDGTMKVTADEKKAGADALRLVTSAMPVLRAAALAGRTAEKVWQLARIESIPAYASAHPSPNVKAGYPERWNAIPDIWREAYKAAVSV